MFKILSRVVRDVFVYLLLCAGIFLMLKGIIIYLPMRDDIGFLRLKQNYLHIKLWKAAFYTHVFTSMFTLIAGLTQFSNEILRNNKGLHRAMGKLYIIAVLFINFPAGMVMAIYANGGITSKIAFVILDSLWCIFTVKAFLAIKKGEITAHKQFMMRSYALTLSAVALRGWQYIISHSIVIDPATLYKMMRGLALYQTLFLQSCLLEESTPTRQ